MRRSDTLRATWRREARDLLLGVLCLVVVLTFGSGAPMLVVAYVASQVQTYLEE